MKLYRSTESELDLIKLGTSNASIERDLNLIVFVLLEKIVVPFKTDMESRANRVFGENTSESKNWATIATDMFDELIAKERYRLAITADDMVTDKSGAETKRVQTGDIHVLINNILWVCHDMTAKLRGLSETFEFAMQLPDNSKKIRGASDLFVNHLEKKHTLNGVEMRALAGDINLLKSAIALKYYTHELNTRLHADWMSLYENVRQMCATVGEKVSGRNEVVLSRQAALKFKPDSMTFSRSVTVKRMNYKTFHLINK